MQESSDLLSPDNATGGIQPVIQIFWDSCMARFGSGKGAIVLGVYILVALYFCNLSIVTCGSRYAAQCSWDQ